MTTSTSRCRELRCRDLTGTLECHCASCHQFFARLEDFDRHRTDLDVPEYLDNECWEPGSIGLILEDGIWSTQEGHIKRRALAEKMRKAREARGVRNQA